MANMRLEHADAARVALQAVVSDPACGVEADASPEVIANLLRDLLPDAPREANLLVTAISVGIPAVLRGHIAEGMDSDTAIRLAAASFEARTAFTHDVANWVAVEFAIALELTEADAQADIGSSAGSAGLGWISASAGPAATELLTQGIDASDAGGGGPSLASPLSAVIRNWRRLALALGGVAFFLAVLVGFGFGYAFHQQAPVPDASSRPREGSAPTARTPAEECTRGALRKAIDSANSQLNSSGWHIVSFACQGRWAAAAVNAVSVGDGEGFLMRSPSGWVPGPLDGGVYNCSDLEGSFGSLVPPQAVAYTLFKDVGRCPTPGG